MFEHHKQPLLSPRQFLLRQLIYLLVALSIILGSLAMGMIGYHFLENLTWIDSLVNAAMLLAAWDLSLSCTRMPARCSLPSTPSILASSSW